jgi:hypothetical protein
MAWTFEGLDLVFWGLDLFIRGWSGLLGAGPVYWGLVWFIGGRDLVFWGLALLSGGLFYT